MDIFFFAMLLALGVNALRLIAQRKRIALLGSYLGQYQIEKHMETLTDGYLRALGEADPQRQTQIWQLLATTETALCDQFTRFAAQFAEVPLAQAQVSSSWLALPPVLPGLGSAGFDMRQLLSIHARGLVAAAKNERGQDSKGRAFTMMAELLLMQHSCHWFCKSKPVASARLLMRHKTPYEQVIAAVAPATRQAYLALIRP